MDELLIHPMTAGYLERLAKQPPHALILQGVVGIGKGTLARAYAGLLLGKKSLANYPYFRVYQPGTTSLGIEQVRDVQKFLQLKTAGSAKIRRVVVLLDAQTMTVEAQNALLKVLEEPPSDTVIILTVSGELAMRPTIYSRSQMVEIKVPDLEAAEVYFKSKGFSEALIRRNYLLSGGATGLLAALLQQDTEHPLVAAIEQAKQLLQAKSFERLIMVDGLAKQKEALPQLLFACKRVAQAGLQQAAAKDQAAQTKHWYNSLQAVLSAEDALAKSANTKLLLDNLMLSL
jgi:DNA polymerase-3 subunit delta'